MPTSSENIVDQNGIELSVRYRFNYNPGTVEECHGLHTIGAGYETELLEVVLLIDGVSLNILPQLNTKLQNAIINKLTYE